MAKETLEKFLIEIKKKDGLFETILPLLTKTNQMKAKTFEGAFVYSSITGIHSVVRESDRYSIRQLPSSNKLKTEFVINIYKNKNKVKTSIILVKEIEPRKTSEDGNWGISINSFKYIK